MRDCEHQKQLEEQQQQMEACLPQEQSLMLEIQTKMHYHQRMVEMLRDDLQRLRDGQDLDWEKWYDQH